MLQRDDGILMEGVVDLAFRDERDGVPCWTVVDFKTDREMADAQAAYEIQVALYVEAVTAATGEPAHGVLLQI